MVSKIESKNIYGKNVNVILIFDSYTKSQYNMDFKRFVNYQKKLSLTGEKGETYFKFYKKIKEFEPIPYETFMDYSSRFFSRVMFELLKNNHSIIISDKLNIQIKVIQTADDTFTYDHLASNREDACYDVAGSLFIQLIVAPFYYLKRIDYSYIYRYFLHEFTHFIDDQKKSFYLRINMRKRLSS